MTSLFPVYRKGAAAICLLAFLIVMLAAAGCMQPAQPQQQAPAPITATRTDNSHITIAYIGSPDTTTLTELEATVTDSTGKTQTLSAGDHLSTTPLKFGSTIRFTGTYNGNDHVIVTGYFLDGSHKLVLDTTI